MGPTWHHSEQVGCSKDNQSQLNGRHSVPIVFIHRISNNSLDHCVQLLTVNRAIGKPTLNQSAKISEILPPFRIPRSFPEFMKLTSISDVLVGRSHGLDDRGPALSRGSCTNKMAFVSTSEPFDSDERITATSYT